MTKAQMAAEQARLQARIAELEGTAGTPQQQIPTTEAAAVAAPPVAVAPAPAPLTLKVSQKGAISVYGLGRFPVTLYKNQMLRFLAIADQIRAFIDANEDSLATK